jgi:hypothetical protein
MIYEGMEREALNGIKNIRERYDGAKRSPFDEAECGHHYARAMASWASVIGFTGFQYSAIDNTIGFGKREGTWFWSNGYAWGKYMLSKGELIISVLHGELNIREIYIDNKQIKKFNSLRTFSADEQVSVLLK